MADIEGGKFSAINNDVLIDLFTKLISTDAMISEASVKHHITSMEILSTSAMEILSTSNYIYVIGI